MADPTLIFIPKIGANNLAALDYFTAHEASFFDTGVAPAPVDRNKHTLLAFPDNDSASLFFPGIMGKDWGDFLITITLFWSAPSIVDDVVWFVSWERDSAIPIAPLANLDVTSFAAEKSVTSVAPPVTGQIREASIVFTKPEADDLNPGDPYRLRIRRDGGQGADTLAGDAQLFRVLLEGPP